MRAIDEGSRDFVALDGAPAPRDPTLREGKRHGDRFFPLEVYRNTSMRGAPVFAAHWHDELEIVRILEGSAVFQISGLHYYVNPGDILFVPQGDLHAAFPLDTNLVRSDAIVFNPYFFLAANSAAAELEYIAPLVRNRPALPRILPAESGMNRQADRALAGLIQAYRSRAFGYELEVRGYLCVFFAVFLRAASGPEQTGRIHADLSWFKRALAFIEAEYHRPLSLGEVAAVACVSPCHLSRFFRRTTGRTLTEHINLLRVQKARQLLLASDRKVIDIAAEVGFASVNHFVELYKRYCGERPSQTRRGDPPRPSPEASEEM